MFNSRRYHCVLKISLHTEDITANHAFRSSASAETNIISPVFFHQGGAFGGRGRRGLNPAPPARRLTTVSTVVDQAVRRNVTGFDDRSARPVSDRSSAATHASGVRGTVRFTRPKVTRSSAPTPAGRPVTSSVCWTPPSRDTRRKSSSTRTSSACCRWRRSRSAVSDVRG